MITQKEIMEKAVMELYRSAGYTPKQVIKDLSRILGGAILAADTTTAIAYTSDKMDMNIEVIEK
jgi:hypothetical protein